jgi:hypothetical protein
MWLRYDLTVNNGNVVCPVCLRVGNTAHRSEQTFKYLSNNYPVEDETIHGRDECG